jgi:hypothetical protein
MMAACEGRGLCAWLAGPVWLSGRVGRPAAFLCAQGLQGYRYGPYGILCIESLRPTVCHVDSPRRGLRAVCAQARGVCRGGGGKGEGGLSPYLLALALCVTVRAALLSGAHDKAEGGDSESKGGDEAQGSQQATQSQSTQQQVMTPHCILQIASLFVACECHGDMEMCSKHVVAHLSWVLTHGRIVHAFPQSHRSKPRSLTVTWLSR